MKKAYLREHGKSGVELIEEAFVLLRSCPLSILAAYYLGSVPFAAGFLVFCSDLGGKPDAEHRLGVATLAMAALFIWMKYFQARFAGGLLARLRGGPPATLTTGMFFSSLSIQTIAHSAGLFILPLAAVAFLPFGWIYAFFQNISSLDDGKSRLRDLVRSAWKLAALWPAQNHVLLSVLSLFSLYVFINWITIVLLAPQLLRQFFGIESVFTHSPLSMLNTTFFAATAALGYLSVDPLLKTCYVLRCFYGKSLQSGEDLRTEVRRLSGARATLAACLLLCVASPVYSAEPPAPVRAEVAAELDGSITTVIQQDKYSWRNPPERKSVENGGLFAGFFKSLSRLLGDVVGSLAEFLRKIIEWIYPRNRQASASLMGAGWLTTQNVLLFAALAIVAAGLALATMRFLRRRSRSSSVVSTAVSSIPDLQDENTSASELPEHEWTRMGRQLLAQGDLRQALRAFYLASLSHLASRGFITIARFKSNRDYQIELQRRGRGKPELSVLFRENVGTFERIWYGLHEVNAELVHQFVANTEKMRSAA